jgi:hypothetical protein
VWKIQKDHLLRKLCGIEKLRNFNEGDINAGFAARLEDGFL